MFALAAVFAVAVFAALSGASWPQAEELPALAAQSELNNNIAAIVQPSATHTPSATATPTPTLTPTLARREFQEQLAPKIAPTTFLPGAGPALPGTLVTQGRRLDFYIGGATFSAEEVASLAIKAEHALGYMQKRFDTHLSQRVSVGIYSRGLAPGRGTRGIAYTDDLNVRIYYNASEDQHNALCILAHELGHALQAEAYGIEAQRRADVVLLEGLATFIAGEYWLSLSKSASFQERARELYRAGYGRNLRTLGNSNAPNDVAYAMWAGFVDYLTRSYGWDAFNQLYVSGRGRAAGSADYEGIYGKSFADLADEYVSTLE
jgi:hypothetical protein